MNIFTTIVYIDNIDLNRKRQRKKKDDHLFWTSRDLKLEKVIQLPTTDIFGRNL